MFFKIFSCSLVLFFLSSPSIFAATSAQQNITYSILAIDAITVTPAPPASITLTVNAAVAGSPPTSASDSSATYAVTTNGTNRKITGILSSALPTGVTLTVTLTPPSGATNVPNASLNNLTPTTLVTGITQIAASGLSITYTLTATAAAAPVSGATNVVTYTIGA